VTVGFILIVAMNHEIFENLYVKFTAELDVLRASDTGQVKNLADALAVVRNSLIELRQLTLADDFDSPSAEIHFFKVIKPKFYAQKILAFERYNLEMNKPVGTTEMLRAYFEDELRQLRRFFQQYAFLYQYYRSGAVELDELYFIRGAEMSSLIIPEMPDPDPLFSTSMDYMFAKFIAFEQMQQLILKQIAVLTGTAVAADLSAPDSGVKWTGKIVNLGELVYGLYYTGQLNHGNAQISEIVAAFERMFSVKIRDVHHTFGEIRERKVSSPSKFIDSMGMAIQQRVEEDLRYKPPGY